MMRIGENNLYRTAAFVPERRGDRPETTGPFPHSQVSGQGPVYLGAQILERVRKLSGVTIGESFVSVPGALAFHLDVEKALGPPAAFVENSEFGHLHPPHDSNLHLMARPEAARIYEQHGWGEAHPEAPNVFLLFGPRNWNEIEVIWNLVLDTYRYATGD